MITYHKIETIFKRDEQGTKRLIPFEWRDRTVEFLRDCEWVWTEKVDGTNIGIYWDGHAVHFQGRTEKANIPKPLLEKLEKLFGGEANEQLFEQLFGEKEVVLFGEGYGNKIQKCGADYNPNGVDFILFDVYVGGIYLERLNVEDIGRAFSIDVVPIVGKGTLVEAIHFVQTEPKSTIGNAMMEGVVARPTVEVKNRKGERIIVKIKVKDFKGLEVEE